MSILDSFVNKGLILGDENNIIIFSYCLLFIISCSFLYLSTFCSFYKGLKKLIFACIGFVAICFFVTYCSKTATRINDELNNALISLDTKKVEIANEERKKIFLAINRDKLEQILSSIKANSSDDSNKLAKVEKIELLLVQKNDKGVTK